MRLCPVFPYANPAAPPSNFFLGSARLKSDTYVIHALSITGMFDQFNTKYLIFYFFYYALQTQAIPALIATSPMQSTYCPIAIEYIIN
jgi:hypothetical protein